ncbi:MAG: cytochrome c3 family protein [Rhizobiales bacterium]|nr:cytochrome c3 family protein [Hyphomicrobiales bacterium]
MRATFKRTFTILAVAFAATLFAGGMSRADEKTEEGVKLEFWKGHFDRGAHAFHDWDNVKEVPAVCARCHGANSLPEYIKDGKTAPAPHVKNGFACTNCHADLLTYARHTVAKVNFASGVSVDTGNNDANLCMTCHQGRESTVSVNKAIAGLPLDTPDPKINFLHVHYFPAGATMYGSEAKVAYEYDGKKYAGRFAHMPNVSTCTGCHQPHGGELKIDRCGGCHEGIKAVADLAKIRMSTRGDFDGNGKEEGLAREIAGLQAQLYAAIQTYSKNVGGTPIAFAKAAYPYWYADSNGNGRIDPEEIKMANKYTAYTPRLLQAVFNYTFSLRDPGGAYHNGRYMLQLLYDSLDSLAASGKAGVTMAGKTRP